MTYQDEQAIAKTYADIAAKSGFATQPYPVPPSASATAELEALAREAGFATNNATSLDGIDGRLARFAALVRAQALEDAAQVCEVRTLLLDRHPAENSEAKACAAAIRALVPAPHPPGAPAVPTD